MNPLVDDPTTAHNGREEEDRKMHRGGEEHNPKAERKTQDETERNTTEVRKPSVPSEDMSFTAPATKGIKLLVFFFKHLCFWPHKLCRCCGTTSTRFRFELGVASVLRFC